MAGHGYRPDDGGADKIVVATAAAAQFEIGVRGIDDTREGGIAAETQSGVAVQSPIDKRHRVTLILGDVASGSGGDVTADVRVADIDRVHDAQVGGHVALVGGFAGVVFAAGAALFRIG